MLRRWVWVAALVAVGCSVQSAPEAVAPQAVAKGPQKGAPALRDAVAQLNARLLAADTQQVGPLLSERRAALERLLAEDARAALALALPESVLVELAHRLPESAGLLEQRGEWTGELEAVVVDSPTLQEVRTDLFLNLGREHLQLHFLDAPPVELRSGQRLQARGLRVGGRVAVETAQPSAPTQGLAASAPACTSTGEQRSITLLVNFPSVPQPSLTVAQVREVFFSTTQRSLTRFWSEVSGGRTSISGDVAGWYMLDRDYGCDEYYQMRDAAIRAADADVDFSQYNRIYVVHRAPPTGCDYGGLGTLACSPVSTQDGQVVASTAWLRAEYMSPNDMGVELTSHEGGHNLSLHHASSRDFGAEVLGPPGTLGTLSEYGDNFSTMGYWNLGTYAAPHKLKLGWMDPGAVREVDTVDGSFTLAPYGTSGGVQALKVRRGNYGKGWLWLEYRQPVGEYDPSLPLNAFGGALVHYEDPYTATGRTHLLDFTPETSSWNDPVLAAGTTWRDPYSNLELTVQPDTTAGLVVDVRYAPVPCVRAQPDVHVELYADWTAPGWDAEGEVAITNRDTLGCPPSTYQVSTVLPAGWPLSQEVPTQVVVEPGATEAPYIPLIVADDAQPGVYTVEATVTGEGYSLTSSDAIEVVPPCVPTPMQVTLSPGNVSINAGQVATFTVTLTNPEGRACGDAWVQLESTPLEGWSNALSATSLVVPTGESRTVTLTKGSPLNASGTYVADVRVLRDRQVMATASASIAVASCQRLAPTLSLSPATSSVQAGSTVSLTATLRNNDSAVCSDSTFSLAALLPTGWQGSLSSSSLGVAPGQSATATLQVTVPASASAGSQGVQVTAARSGQAGASASASVNVTLPPLQVTLSASASQYKRKSNAPLTATVWRGTQAVSQASVRFIVYEPDGSTATATLSTDAQGRAVWNYPTSVRGTHTASATATAGTQSASSNTVSFSVN